MWRRFLLTFAITAAAAFAAAVALILVADPLGLSPVGLGRGGGLAIEDRRYVAARVVRSGRFDSFLVGTSTIHSVDPARAEETFGGRFANLAIHGGTPYELSRVLALIGRRVPDARRVIIGIDAGRWCKPDGYERYHKEVVFPEWLYDDNGLDQLPALFNLTTLRGAAEQLSILLGLQAPRLPENGYRNNLIEANWNADEAKRKLYGGKGIAALDADTPVTSRRARRGSEAREFPDLDLLQKTLKALPQRVQVIAVMMPSHAVALAKADRGTVEACKRRLEAVLREVHGTAIDFRIPSAWTRNDENFWDRNHIRLPLAEKLIERIGEAVTERRDPEDGVYRILASPAVAHRAAK